ncbi:hypothetical protein [Streptomyces crystallinus]|uniref:Transposase n=1 Tax=Streptomyces crystallinus TaxID=68191 RepID=A0ABN1GSE4_9ACTN
MAVRSPRSPVPDATEVLCARDTRRLPAHLEDLTGPAQGTVDLPLHVVWSGRRSYELSGLKSRISLYRTVPSWPKGSARTWKSSSTVTS